MPDGLSSDFVAANGDVADAETLTPYVFVYESVAGVDESGYIAIVPAFAPEVFVADFSSGLI